MYPHVRFPFVALFVFTLVVGAAGVTEGSSSRTTVIDNAAVRADAARTQDAQRAVQDTVAVDRAQRERLFKRSPAYRDQVDYRGKVVTGIAQQPFFLTDTKAQILEGGGEFEFLLDEISYVQRQAIRIQWTTEHEQANFGTWEVRNLTTGGNVVASGQTPSAPDPGKISRFTIAEEAFLSATPPAESQHYEIRVRPFIAENQPAGPASLPVLVTHLSDEDAPEPVDFGDGARFPTVRLIENDEKYGQAHLTQIFYAYTDVAVRVSNPGNQPTDPMFLGLADRSLLYRQEVPKVQVPSLKPGEAKTYAVRMQAILPPPASQTPQAQQHREWRRTYDDRCGPELQAVLDWRGPQSNTPIDPHREILLAPPGWEDLVTGSWSNPICADGDCLKICDMEKSIRAQLDGHVVGYAYLVGQRYPKMGAGGLARTQADGADVPFTPQTPITVASVSKLVTAIAAMRILDQNGEALTDAVGEFFPAEWNVDPFLANVTFGQYLAQRSGIKDYGNVALTYAKLQSFFEQDVSNAWMPNCMPASTIDPLNPVNPSNMSFCYSNYNTGVMRILLPAVANRPVDNNLGTRPQTLANQYEQLVKQNVFNRVGQPGPACRPPSFSAHAFAYQHPGDQAGVDWGDVSLTCGAAGWYLSAEDMGKVLFSLNQRSGHIFDENSTETQLDTMRQQGLGLDIANADWLEKNGGWGSGGRSITTSAAVFGPVTGPNVVAVLFINSDIGSGPAAGQGARQVLKTAYDAAIAE